MIVSFFGWSGMNTGKAWSSSSQIDFCFAYCISGAFFTLGNWLIGDSTIFELEASTLNSVTLSTLGGSCRCFREAADASTVPPLCLLTSMFAKSSMLEMPSRPTVDWLIEIESSCGLSSSLSICSVVRACFYFWLADFCVFFSLGADR